MEISKVDIERIVKSVLSEIKTQGIKPASNIVNNMARTAMLVDKQKFEIREYQIPEISDDEILVKVEGCGVCGTDAHEYKNDPFGLIPLVLGHEGSGEIVRLGKNIKKDSAGKPVKIGDKIVTSMIFGDDPSITMFDTNKMNVSDNANVYGLLPDGGSHLNGWFADYLLLGKDAAFFEVNDLDLDSRLLVEPAAVVVHAVERAKTTGIIRFNSKVAVQGCGPIGLLLIAVVRTMGVENIIAIDGDDRRLAMAREMGASDTLNFRNYKDFGFMREAVSLLTDGNMADFAFQCTGSPAAASNIWKLVRRGGGLCELGFFVDNGDATINPHHDICKKEITAVGAWVYTLRDYPTAFDFLRRARGIGIPIDKLITHRFPLERIDDALKANIAMDGIKIAIINN